MKACYNCQSTEVEHDPAQGNSVCTRCGTVLEENTVVAEVSFAEHADGSHTMQGTFVSAESGRPARGKPPGSLLNTSLAGSEGSHEMTLYNARRRLTAMGTALGLNDLHIDQAHRWYTLALQHQFTRGRLASLISATCLYIVCRMERTPHMLLDFADLLQTSVYVLGSTFLRLCQLLNLQLPFVDPSFYVTRFAAKLEFGEQTQQVSNTALRLVARMKRDWIQTGRRPAGVCAAGLFIAARMHGFVRTEREVVRVVHVCEATLKRRLEEFAKTPSSALSPSEFESIWLEEEADPPSFNREPKKKNLRLVDLSKILIDGISLDQSLDLILEKFKRHLDGDELKESLFGQSSNIPSSWIHLLPQVKRKKAGPIQMTENRDDHWSDFDNDPEVETSILTKTEAQTKTEVWNMLNQEYLEAQSQKLQEQEKQESKHDDSVLTPPVVKKKRTYQLSSTPQTATAPVAETPLEAVRHAYKVRKLSKKINYEALETLFLPTPPETPVEENSN